MIRRAVPARRSNPALHNYIHGRDNNGWEMLWIIGLCLLVLALVWVLLAGQPAALPEHYAKIVNLQARVDSQATIIVYYQTKPTPTPTYRYRP